MNPTRLRLGAMVCLLAAAFTAFSIRSVAAVPESVAERLRSAVRLPQVSLDYEFGMSRTMGWMMEDDPGDVSVAISELESAIASGRAEAETRLQIARLAARLDDEGARHQALERARSAWRARLDAAPDDAGALSGLASVLELAGETDEAERLFRRSVELGAARFEVWNRWAGFLTDRALSTLFGGTNVIGQMRLFHQGQDLPPADVERARKFAAEAMAASDRAVALLPESPLPYATRARAHGARKLAEVAARSGGGDAQRERALAAFPKEAVPDLEAASARRPEDYRLHAAIIWHRYVRQIMSADPASDGTAPADRLPRSEREALDARLAQLNRLAESPRSWVAAGALESLAISRFTFFNDPQGGGELALRTIRVDPDRRQARDLAIALLVVRKDWPAVVEVSTKLIGRRPDPRLWLIRAKAEFEQGRFEAAASAIGEGLKLDAANAPLLASRFALWLRTGEIPARATELRMEIEATFEALRTVAGTPAGAALYQSFFPTTLIASALDGEGDDARARARKWFAEHPDDDYARQVLEILQAARP